MEQNIGLADRYIRLTLGGLMLTAGAARWARRADLSGAVIGLLGGMMLAEGVLGVCPLYSTFGINTRGAEQGQEQAQSGHPTPGHDTNDVIQPYEGI